MSPIKPLLNSVTPYNLKKYGLYTILSFFISVCVILGADDMRVRDKDVKYERLQNEQLRNMLDEQYKLKIEQEHLIKITTDTTARHEKH